MSKGFNLTFILSFFSPVFALFVLIKNKAIKEKRFLLTIIIVFYGITLPLTELSDGYRHQQNVINAYSDMSWSKFASDFVDIITFQVTDSSSDVYKHIISYLVGSLLQAPYLFFFVVSIVYGYFYSGVLLSIFEKFSNQSISLHIIIFVVCFFFNRGPEGIQTVRTWTGLWILYYGFIKYIEHKHFKYLLLALATPLIHFGYFIMAIPSILILITRVKLKPLYFFFLLSTITNLYSNEDIPNDFKGYSLINLKFDQYERSEEELTQEAQLERLNQRNKIERTWYKKLELSGYFKWLNNFLIYGVIFFGIGTRYMNNREKKILSAGVLTLTFANLLFFIFAVSNRMHIIGMSFVLGALLMMFFRSYEFKLHLASRLRWKLFVLIFSVLYIPKFIYSLSFLLSQTSLFVLFGPFIPIIDGEVNIALLDVIKIIILGN